MTSTSFAHVYETEQEVADSMAHMLGSANSQRCLVRWHDVSKTRVAPRAIAPSAGVAPKHTCLKRDIQSSKVAQRHVLCHASPDTCPDLSAYLKLKRQQGDGELLAPGCLAKMKSQRSTQQAVYMK